MVMEIVVSVILLLVGIAVLIIIHICVVGRAFRARPISYNPVRAERIPGLNPDEINELPCIEYRAVDENGPGNNGILIECAVCLESYKAGEKCRILPVCNHIFHCDCIDSWLLKTGACPICRTAAKTTRFKESCGGGGGGGGGVFSGEVGLQLV